MKKKLTKIGEFKMEKHKIYLAAVLFLFVKIALPQNNNIPDFNLQTLNGTYITSQELRGKVVLLDFWDTRCGPCIKLMPHLEKLYAKYKDNPNVVILVVNAGWQLIDDARSFVSKRSYDLPFAYMTKQESKKLKVRELPKTIVIDKQFRYRLQFVGYDGYDPDKDSEPVAEYEKLIEKLLAE
jgi:thiol-disulfide isomerase/thioredoxin